MSATVRFLLGPTAAGKTRVATRLARGIGGVVVCVDARQIYQGFDVATGKEGEPGSVDLPGLGRVHAWMVDGVPQLGIDLASPTDRWTVARWKAWAARTLEALNGARVPVVVSGGTGLYAESLLRGFHFGDPGPPLASPSWSPRVVVLDPPRDQLRSNVEARVRSWFEGGGLLEEARRLRAGGVPEGSEAWSAIGYREALDVIDARESREGAIARAIRRTWDYSRRQRTFFRHHIPGASWVSTGEEAERALALETPMNALAVPVEARSS